MLRAALMFMLLAACGARRACARRHALHARAIFFAVFTPDAMLHEYGRLPCHFDYFRCCLLMPLVAMALLFARFTGATDDDD